MYWWNIDRLAEELKTGTLPEKEKMKYLLADSILTAASSGPGAASFKDNELPTGLHLRAKP